jgi:hypothetical protein
MRARGSQRIERRFMRCQSRRLRLRSAVIYRNLSLGSQSPADEQRVARLLSAHTTCRPQRRPLHAYLADAITATTAATHAPPLT